MKVLDVIGLQCPIPLIETKKALKDIEPTESLKVITDNITSVKNIMHFLTDNSIPAVKKQVGDYYEIIINNPELDLEDVDEKAYCTPALPVDNSYVMVFSTDSIGQGSHELGFALIGALFATLKNTDNLPSKIMFLNSGINLVLKDSNFLNDLKALEKKNVEFITCGTCLDYYEKMDQLGIGRVTNMLEIIESMQEAQKVITI